MPEEKCYGKYRAIVVDIDDPEQRGRIRVKCPDVLGEYASDWCDMCAPGVQQVTGDLCVPDVGDSVWVEFEDGDPQFPIYTGGWYYSNSTPADAYVHEGQTYEDAVKRERIIGHKGAQIRFDQYGDISLRSDNLDVPLNDGSMSLLGVSAFTKSLLLRQIATAVGAGDIPTRSPSSL